MVIISSGSDATVDLDGESVFGSWFSLSSAEVTEPSVAFSADTGAFMRAHKLSISAVATDAGISTFLDFVSLRTIQYPFMQVYEGFHTLLFHFLT